MQEIIQTAPDLLHTSPLFESYLPHSYKNTMNALALLGTLGELTERNLKNLKPVTQPSLPKNSTPETSRSTPAQTSPQSKKALEDQKLIEALLELRKSSRFTKRTPGVYQTILRPNHP